MLQLLRYQVPSLSTKHLDVLVNCFLQCDKEAVDSSMVRLVTHVSVLIALVVIAMSESPRFVLAINEEQKPAYREVNYVEGSLCNLLWSRPRQVLAPSLDYPS